VFVDRDGTLIVEPADQQVDRLDKIRLLPGVIPALLEIQRAGFALVMATNQDGLGTERFPEADFRLTQQFILDLFSSQGIEFDAVCVCPHFPQDGCGCRKPKIGLVTDYLLRTAVDRDASFMIGDRATDLEFAGNLGVTGLRVRVNGTPQETWETVARRIVRGRARHGWSGAHGKRRFSRRWIWIGRRRLPSAPGWAFSII